MNRIGSILVSGVNMYIREINTQSLVKSLSGQMPRLSFKCPVLVQLTVMTMVPLEG